jgi:serine/threonine-protein kinase
METRTPIDTAYWKRIDALLASALALSPPERRAWLDALQGDDERLKPVLEGMLARADEDSGFMEQPVAVGLQALEAHPKAPSDDKAGDVVGAYRLLHPLGSGGMGTVWCAERADGTLQRRVALKLPRQGWSPGLAERLAREIEILETLEHPHIARLYDAGYADGGRPYLAMEIIEGVPIDEYCRDRKLTLRDRLRLFLQVARAVAYAHARLVVHRDLKPHNILVDSHGVAHIVDFGVAMLLDAAPEAASPLTQALGRAFTPAYASPEHMRGERITVASDVYSLGVVLYELLSGKRPYRLKYASAAALEEAIATADVVPPSSQVSRDRPLSRALRGDLDTIVGRALRKDVAERYPTVDAFAADIERHLRGEPVLARPDTFLYRAGKFVRRHRAGVTFAGLIAVVAALGVAGVLYQAQVTRQERDRALMELRFAESAEEFTRFLLGEQTGRPVAPEELLQRARTAVAGQFAGDPVLRARMQLVLSELYGEVSDFKKAEALAREARASAIQAGDRSALAQAECALGSLLGTTGREKEGAELFAANIPHVDANAAADPRAFQMCHKWQGNFRRNRGRPGAGDDFEMALKSMESTGSLDRTTRVRLKASIADSYAIGGRVGDALRLYDEASAELARIGRANTSAGRTLSNNHITNLVRAGHLRRAEQVYLRAKEDAGLNEVPSADLAIAYGRVLVDMGRLDEARAMLQGAADEKARIGHRRGEAHALLHLARAICASGSERECETAVERARARFEGTEPPRHSVFAILQYLRGMAAMRQGDAAGAQRWLEEAVTLFKSASDRNPISTRALALLALVLDESGEKARAQETAALAVSTAREMTSGLAESEWVGSALLAQAKIHESQGDLASARKEVSEARRHLEGTLGMDAPAMRPWDAMIRRLET